MLTRTCAWDESEIIRANFRAYLNQDSQNDVLGRSALFSFLFLGLELCLSFRLLELWSLGIHPPCHSHCHHSSLLCHVEEGRGCRGSRRCGTPLVKGSLKSAARCEFEQPNLAEQPTIHDMILRVGCFYWWMLFQFAVIGICLRIGHPIPFHRSAMYMLLSRPSVRLRLRQTLFEDVWRLWIERKRERERGIPPTGLSDYYHHLPIFSHIFNF